MKQECTQGNFVPIRDFLQKRKYLLYDAELPHHVWKFFLSSCRNIIRALVRSNLKYRDKIYSIKKLTGNSEIHNILKRQKRNLSLNRMLRLYCTCITGQYNQLLYLVAFIDVHVVCDNYVLRNATTAVPFKLAHTE